MPHQSVRDLSLVGRAILNSTLLPRNSTGAWLKPVSHTASLHGSLGFPWEIVRLDLPVVEHSNQTRTVDLYTKAGGIGAYGALLALSPDHDLGFARFWQPAQLPGFPGQNTDSRRAGVRHVDPGSRSRRKGGSGTQVRRGIHVPDDWKQQHTRAHHSGHPRRKSSRTYRQELVFKWTQHPSAPRGRIHSALSCRPRGRGRCVKS